MATLDDFFYSDDPLTRDTALFLIAYAEEDDRVDYKLTVDIAVDKQWLGLTKDISAFANTKGGYLVFGKDDHEKNIVGLSKNTENYLFRQGF